MATRRSLAAEICVEGAALHAGVAVHMRLAPAASGGGICFRRSDLAGSLPIEALWSNVSETRLGTVLTGSDGVSVAVVEHLMSALAGAEIDDCLVEVDAPELPILQGDALSYLALIDKAGVREHRLPRAAIYVRQGVSAGKGGSSARLLPSATRQFFFEIDFESEIIGQQSLEFTFTQDGYRRDIAPARTFGFLAEAEQLRAAGYGRGASLENTLVVDGNRLVNPELLRFPDEFVRHKVLDAIGDLQLAGATLFGRFEGRRSSHALNNALLRELFSDPANYERIAL